LENFVLFNQATWLLTILLVGSGVGFARVQQVTTKKSTGTVSGRVFLITEGGDLKPARFADVFLISDKVLGQESAERVFVEEHSRELEAETKRMESDSSAASESVDCRNDLLMIIRSVQAAAKWAEKGNVTFGLLSTKTDEEGQFQMPEVELDRDTANPLLDSDGKKVPGKEWEYTLVAKGRAGANDAYWETEIIIIQLNGKTQWRVGAGEFVPGRDVHIKLSSPEKSCLVIPHD
jgi:hypothetical protein